MRLGTVNITNVYNKPVVDNVAVARVSINGGSGGIRARATAGELAAAHAQHLRPTVRNTSLVDRKVNHLELMFVGRPCGIWRMALGVPIAVIAKRASQYVAKLHPNAAMLGD